MGHNKTLLSHLEVAEVPHDVRSLRKFVLSRLRKTAADGRDFGLRVTGHLPTSALRVTIYRLLFGMKIAQGARIDCDCTIWGPRRISIGSGSVINRSVVLDGRFPLTIGKNVSISLRTIILTLQHDLSDPEFASMGASVAIGDHVFIGAQAIILPGVSIGEGAAVGAGSVVTSDVSPYTIVAGVPAKPIGSRTRNLKYELRWR